MKASLVLFDFYKKRIRSQALLKQLLEQQQETLLANDIDRVRVIANEQLTHLKTIQKLEIEWQNFLKSNFEPHQLAASPIPFTEVFKLKDRENQQLRRLDHQFKAILKDVSALKKSNQLLMHRSLSFVQKLVKGIVESNRDTGVYGPSLKSAAANVIINRRM